MRWTGFHLNKAAWATANTSGPTAISTTAPTYWCPMYNPCGKLRVQFVAQGADNTATATVALYAISSDDQSKPRVYISQLWYTIATSVTLGGATLTDDMEMLGRSGVVRWADTITGETNAISLSLAFDTALGPNATNSAVFEFTDAAAELVFANASGLCGIAFGADITTATAFNILINYEQG